MRLEIRSKGAWRPRAFERGVASDSKKHFKDAPGAKFERGVASASVRKGRGFCVRNIPKMRGELGSKGAWHPPAFERGVASASVPNIPQKMRGELGSKGAWRPRSFERGVASPRRSQWERSTLSPASTYPAGCVGGGRAVALVVCCFVLCFFLILPSSPSSSREISLGAVTSM